MIKCSAPGKVIICGEYAVLQGSRALVLGVNRRVQVSLSEQPGAAPQSGVVHVLAPTITESICTLVWQGNTLCSPQTPALDFFCQLFNSLAVEFINVDRFKQKNWLFELDSSAFFEGDNKFGLGSSAALTVALGRTLMAYSKRCDQPETCWPTLHAAHSFAQGKQGSGVDIAASLSGGISCFRNFEHKRCELVQQTLPKSLDIRFYWTGKSASTPAHLRSLSSWRQGHIAQFDHHMSELGLLSAKVCESLDAQLFLNNLHAFCHALKAFDKDANIGIYGGGHESLSELAAPFTNIVYKPCGAGGGDLGIAISEDSQTLDAFSVKVSHSGAKCVPLHIDKRGCVVESANG